MKLSVLPITRNLIFADNGVIWATWRLKGHAYGHAPAKRKWLIKKLHEELLQGLDGEVMLSGLTVDIDPASVAEAMLEGLDLDVIPAWCAEVEATLDQLEMMDLGQQTYWLSLPLKITGAKEAYKKFKDSLARYIAPRLGLPPAAPSPELIDAALRQVATIQNSLPSRFEAHPATSAELAWMHMHHQHRGLSMDSMDSLKLQPIDQDQRTSLKLVDPHIDPGAQTDDPEINQDKIFERRYLKVTAKDIPSYQSFHVVSSMPQGGFVFPGGEWMAALDQLTFPVDWVWRLKIEPAKMAKRRNSKNEARLKDQYEQRTDTGITGSHTELDVHAQDMKDFQEALNRSEREVGIRITPIFAVGGASAEEVKERSRILEEFYRGMDVELHTPMPSQQGQLYQAMHINQPTVELVREYEHETTGFHLSGAIPLASNRLGTDKGFLLGYNITGGLPTAVFHDIEGQVTGNNSGSFAVCGMLGGGKTYTLKKITGHVVDRNGRFVAIDRSSTGEWEFFGKSITDCITLNTADPQYTLDPLRVFGIEQGAQDVKTLAAMLMGIKATDQLGVTLSRSLAPEYLREHKLHSLAQVGEHLRTSSELKRAEELGERMEAFSFGSLGRVIFDDSLPPLPLDARGIVFRTYGLHLPTEQELSNKHLFDQLSIEKIFGRALYAVIARLAEKICFQDRNDLALFMAAEAHHLTSNPQGLEVVNTFLSEGRKALAAIGMDSQIPTELGPKRGLIPTRILVRQTDRDLALAGLEWFGLTDREDDMDELVETIQSFSPAGPDGKVIRGREGESLFQDTNGNIGLLKISPPALNSRARAASSTPGKQEEVKVGWTL